MTGRVCFCMLRLFLNIFLYNFTINPVRDFDMKNTISKIQIEGYGTPNLNSISTEEQLLISAWAYNLKYGIPIHRFSLYCFVQTHLVNKSEENLQKTLETSPYWSGLGEGRYSITNLGKSEMGKWEPVKEILSVDNLYSFNKVIKK